MKCCMKALRLVEIWDGQLGYIISSAQLVGCQYQWLTRPAWMVNTNKHVMQTYWLLKIPNYPQKNFKNNCRAVLLCALLHACHMNGMSGQMQKRYNEVFHYCVIHFRIVSHWNSIYWVGFYLFYLGFWKLKHEFTQPVSIAKIVGSPTNHGKFSTNHGNTKTEESHKTSVHTVLWLKSRMSIETPWSCVDIDEL